MLLIVCNLHASSDAVAKTAPCKYTGLKLCVLNMSKLLLLRQDHL